MTRVKAIAIVVAGFVAGLYINPLASFAANYWYGR